MVMAVYPGTFDPVTLGHLDVATRTASIFDTLVVAVYAEPEKEMTFTIEERLDLWKRSAQGLSNVEITGFKGLAVEMARKVGAQVIIRGLRTASDFEYEFEMTFMNRDLAPEINTICLMPSPAYHYISSSLLKEVTRLGGDITNFVPSPVADALNGKLS